MINNTAIEELERLGFGTDIDALESYIASLQDAAGLGTPIVTNTMYDQYHRLLGELKPSSYVLHRNWENEDFELDEKDELLNIEPMKSITTIQKITDLNKFKNKIGDETFELTATEKLDGHAIRGVYEYGQLVSGSTRGRYKKGRDILRHLKAVLPNYIEEWKNIRLVEVRGEMLVSLKNFEKLRHYLKTPLSSVTSLIRASVTDEELELLSCVVFKVVSNGEINIRSRREELNYLENLGFEIPYNITTEGVNYYNLGRYVDACIDHFENLYNSNYFEYETDGIVVTIDDKELMESLGVDKNSYIGNFALKMGNIWESNLYCSTIEDIEFVHGKRFIIPKAIINPVDTVRGATVKTVPLHNIGVMRKFGLVIGSKIFFKFGGETGVTLVTEDGSPISLVKELDY